ncbi:MAG: GNAT family N-acetyltransferase [Coriobacteriales bacterium]|nr:GNAT family N-acetyltransferase [Coriobacteriales bacterium]
MSIDFVLAKAGDEVIISMLRQKIWDTTYRGIYPDTVIDDFNYEWHQQQDLKKISDPSFTVYLINYGDENIGYFIFQHTGSNVWLHSLYVLQEYQYRGIGKQAFAILKDYCREKGINHFACNCSPHNKNAMQFYQRMGGVVTKTDTGHKNKQEDGVIFEFNMREQ